MLDRHRFILSILLGLVLTLGSTCGNFVHRSDVPSQVQDSLEVFEQIPMQPENLPESALSRTTMRTSSAIPEGLYNPPRGDVRWVVISDLNSAYGSIDYEPEVDRAIALLPFWHPDLVLCGGDMVAGQSLELVDRQLRAMWSAFDTHITLPLRQTQVPFGFTIGNHDASGALGSNGTFRFQRERNIASEYWNDPQHDPGIQFIDRYQFPFYYTFVANDIFFLVWDGSSHQIPAEQLAWVERSLASSQAQQAKMRVLIGHLPLYGIAVGRDQPGEVMANADHLQTLLERYNVHTYISGHQHAYYPGHRGSLQLLHAGALGSGTRQLIDSTVPRQKTLTVVDVTFDSPDLTTYTTYDMQSSEVISMGQLPRLLMGHNGIVLRRDVEWDTLTPSEKAICRQRLGEPRCRA